MAKLTEHYFRSKDEAYAKMSDSSKEQQDFIHREVGSYMAVWANTESAFLELLKRLLRTSFENTIIVFFGITANCQKMEMIRRLILQNVTPDLQSQCLEIVRRFKGPTRLRNELAHSEYALNLDDYHYEGVWTTNVDKAEGKMVELLKFDAGRMNQIDDMRQKMSDLSRDLYAFCKRLDERSS